MSNLGTRVDELQGLKELAVSGCDKLWRYLDTEKCATGPIIKSYVNLSLDEDF